MLRHRTLSHRDSRGILGDRMGGYGAIRFGRIYSDVLPFFHRHLAFDRPGSRPTCQYDVRHPPAAAISATGLSVRALILAERRLQNGEEIGWRSVGSTRQINGALLRLDCSIAMTKPALRLC